MSDRVDCPCSVADAHTLSSDAHLAGPVLMLVTKAGDHWRLFCCKCQDVRFGWCIMQTGLLCIFDMAQQAVCCDQGDIELGLAPEHVLCFLCLVYAMSCHVHLSNGDCVGHQPY